MKPKNLVKFKKDVYLGLEKAGERIFLKAYHKNGEPWDRGIILNANKKENKIYMHAGVNKNLGFELDACNSVVCK